MEQCSNGTVAEDTNALSGVRDTVVASVAEKHESELQEKTVACGDSVPDLCTEDSTKLSAGSSKEDGELSSSSDAECNEQQPTEINDRQKVTDIDLDVTECDDVAVTDDKINVSGENPADKPFESYRRECDSVDSDVSDTDTDISELSSSSDTSSSDHYFGARATEQNHASSSNSQILRIRRKKARTRGEILLEDLPPIEDLHITVDENVRFTEIGKIDSIVEVLVVIQSNAGIPPLAEETILFLDNKIVLGKIFETFGPVSCPLYSVRFNSMEHIAEHGIEIGAKVYYVPSVSEWTHYVFLEHVKAMLGSDASWENDNEPPTHCLDYSDDEIERKAKAKLRMRVTARDDDSGNAEDNDSSSVDDSKSSQKTEKCRRRRQYSAERFRAEPNTSTWPPPDRPHRGRGRGSLRGRTSNSSGRGRQFDGPPRRPWIPHHHRFTPAHTFPPGFVPPNFPVPLGPYVFPPRSRPNVPPPPSLVPPRFIAPPPTSQNTISTQPVPVSPSFVGCPRPGEIVLPNPVVPPPPLSGDPSISCPSSSAPPQTWTFGMPPLPNLVVPPPPLPTDPSISCSSSSAPRPPPPTWTFGMPPPFPPPFPPPPVSSALSNCWNRPPPPPPPPPPPFTPQNENQE